MKSSGGKPKVIFDPVVGRFVPLPKEEPAPRSVMVGLWVLVACISLGAIAGFVAAFFSPDLALAGIFAGALLGFLLGVVLLLLASLIRKALRRNAFRQSYSPRTISRR